ncbi:MAG TPA: glycosyltransferase family 2 protein [bacterium]|nr:glycosyltransferase family 2 protein [bacterium]
MNSPVSPRLKVTVLVPTLNEIDGIKAVLPRIKREWYDQLLVVDGGSTDGTPEYAKAQGYPVIHQKTKGVRRSYVEALPSITGDIVIPFSPDGNCIPEAIPQLVEKMKEGYDMVIASRYAEGAKSEDDDFITGIGNWAFTMLINGLYGTHLTDNMGIFRAWKTSLLTELDLDKEESFAMEKLTGVSGIGLEPLLSIRAAKRKMRVTEIPASEPKRIGGERKMLPFRWGFVFLLQVFRELYYWK